jgi:fimbrial isopeptide formation D2 family protein
MMTDRMRTKRKTEEKKMSMSKNIARLAVTAGLTAALSFGGVMVPVTMAFADGATIQDDSIVIAQSESNKSESNNKTRFVPYQIFKAKVHDDKNGKVTSDVEWADTITNSTTKNEIIEAIRKDASNGDKLPPTPSAQDIADWLGTYVSESEKGAGVIVKNGDLLNTIAATVKNNEQPSGEAFDAGGSFKAESTGYYLFLTDDSSIGSKDEYSNKNQTGTSPIFAVVGGTGVTVTEKTGIPTVTKKVKDDKPNSEWADKADSQVGQDVQYQLTGTVASNIATFGTYYYQFHDTLSAGLTANTESVEVRIYTDNNDSTGTLIDKAANHYEVGCDPQTDGKSLLTVTFGDLKTAGVVLTPDSKVVVTYTAQLNSEKAVVGSIGNDNEVKLIYSNNPMSEGKGESVPDTVRDYTYALKIIKQDAAPEATKLDGVKFTIRATDPDDAGSMNKYVNSNGVLVDKSYEFTTANGGEIYVKGLDAGTYTVHEVEDSNPGYNTLDDFTFTIKPEGLNKDEGVALDEKTAVNTLKVTVEKPDSATMVTPSVDDGTVTLTVKNKKGSNLPLTGLNGVTFTWIAGGAVLCIGVAHLIRSRKQAEESEQE